MRKARACKGGLDDGEWMIKKADAISGFLTQQRNRTHEAAAKSAWDAAFQQLVTEGDVLNNQLLQLLQQATACSSDAAAGMQDVLQLHQQLAAEAQTERLQIMAQVQDLSGLVHSMRCCGLSAVEHVDDTVASLRQEISWLAEDLQSNMSVLAASAEQLIQEVAADSQAVLAGPEHRSSAGLGPCSAACGNGCPNPTLGRQAEGPVTQLHCDDGTANGTVAGSDANAGTFLAESSSSTSTAGCTIIQDEQLLQLLSRHHLAPERLKQQVQEAYSALYLQQQQQQVQQLAASADQQGSTSMGAFGGWSADDHGLFVKLRGLAYKSASSGRSSGGTSGGRGCSRAAVVQRLCLMMPGKSIKELELHEAWYTAAKLHQRRMTDLTTAWQRQRSSFFADSDQMLAEATAAAVAAAEAAASKLAWEAAGQALHGQLEEMQQVKEQQQQDLATQQAAESAAATAKAAAHQAAWMEQHAAKKAEVAAYKEQQQQQQATAQQLAQQAEAEARAAAAAAIEAQKPAVAARQALSRDRLHLQLEQQKQRQLKLESRKQRLAAIAEALSPHVARDPQRLLQPTAASVAAIEAGLEEVGSAAAAAFRPVHGYTSAQVAADPRFKVVEALTRAGLINGAAKGYVGQVVSGMQPVTALRRGNLTTGQLQAMQSRQQSQW